MKSKWLLVVLVVGVALLTTAIIGSKVANAASSPTVVAASAKTHSPASTANVMYVTFPAELGPYCVAAFSPSGQLIIVNGATSVLLRFNSARNGWDQMVVDGIVYAIDPSRVQKLLTGNCLIVP